MEQEQEILEEEIDEDYVPTEEGAPYNVRRKPDAQCRWCCVQLVQTNLCCADLLDYANWLGIELPKERVRSASLHVWQLDALGDSTGNESVRTAPCKAVQLLHMGRDH